VRAGQDILAEAERDRIYERVPPEKPYGSLDALLKAELGVTREESVAKKRNKRNHQLLTAGRRKVHSAQANPVTTPSQQ
jgi:hypothetical protein